MKNFLVYILLIAAGFLPAAVVLGQDSTSINNHNKKVAIGSFATYGAALIGLNQLWYKGYEKSSFHLFDDNKEWLQMDKIGHGFSTYALSSFTYDLYKHDTKAAKNKALIYSSGSAFLFLTTVEVFDGLSKNWGFSGGDFLANTGGIALFVGQELVFDKQIVRLKFSYQNTEFRKLRPNTFGETTLQSGFKDYNGQTLWASLNLNSLSSHIHPKWLNVAFGYGANNMIFGNQRKAQFNAINYVAYREYYLSLDVDWKKIGTKKKWLKWIFRVANTIKIPAPTLELSHRKVPKFYWLYF